MLTGDERSPTLATSSIDFMGYLGVDTTFLRRILRHPGDEFPLDSDLPPPARSEGRSNGGGWRNRGWRDDRAVPIQAPLSDEQTRRECSIEISALRKRKSQGQGTSGSGESTVEPSRRNAAFLNSICVAGFREPPPKFERRVTASSISRRCSVSLARPFRRVREGLPGAAPSRRASSNCTGRAHFRGFH